MLVGVYIFNADFLAFRQYGQCDFNIVSRFIRSFFIEGGKTRKYFVFTVEMQSYTSVCNFSSHGLIDCRAHLAGNISVVYQPVQHKLLPAQRIFNGIGCTCNICRTNGLMGVLGVLSSFEFIFFCRQIFFTVFFRNKGPQGIHGVVTDSDTVSTDIGYKTLGALSFQVYTFIKLLYDLHGLGSGKTQFSSGFLLQAGCREGWSRLSFLFLLFDFGNSKTAVFNQLPDLFSFFTVFYRGFLSVNGRKPCVEESVSFSAGYTAFGTDIPIFLRNKIVNFPFPVNNHPRGNALYASGRQSFFYFNPQQRADFITNQPVKRPSGLLRINPTHIKFPGIFDGSLYCFFRYFIKFNPAG